MKTGIYGVRYNNSIYVGQSIDIDRRFNEYSKLKCKGQPKLMKSLIDNGVCNHVLFILHELPSDCDKNTLDTYEQFYMDTYREAGFIMLNLKMAGAGGKHTQETKEKISKALTGIKRQPMSEAQKEYRRNLYKGRKLSESTRSKMSASRKGMKQKPVTEEARYKMRLARIGKPSPRKGIPTSLETKLKISKANIKHGNRSKFR